MSPDRIDAVARLGARVTVLVRVATLLALASSWAPAALAATAATKTPAKANTRTATRTSTRTATRTSTRTGKNAEKKAGKNARANSKKDPVKPAPLPAPKGKVAVLAFDGDGANPLRARVVRLLRAKGLKVITTLRPVDTPEQFREMADTLVLVAFLDGEASEDGDQASVTVHVRSGVSGLRVASATLAGERRKLPAAIDHDLWPQLAPPLSRVSVDAAKPRKREREPMRIEAGTPLGNDNPDGPPKGT